MNSTNYKNMKNTVSDGFPYYIELMENTDYRSFLAAQKDLAFLETIREEKAAYRYAPEKWSIKEMIGHVTDHERIMGYRMLRFSRKDRTQLAGYDHDMFVDNSRFNVLSFQEILTDFKKVRAATVSFIDTLSEQQLHLKGAVGEFEAEIEDFIKATVGHEVHHLNVIRAKYM